MSDTEAMVRIIENAAEHARLNLGKLQGLTLHGTDQRVQIEAVASLAYARAVLQMVAASVSPERRTIVDELISHFAVGFDNYEVWADANDGAALTDAELVSIGRYLRAQVGGER